jgi:DNA-directed RNA polymerase specialized sigma24 family protein
MKEFVFMPDSSSSSASGAFPVFAPSSVPWPSHEHAVKDIRACLRKGDVPTSHRHFTRWSRGLLPYIEKQAQRILGRYGREAFKDGIALALTELWVRVSRFDQASDTLHLERRFGQAFKFLLLDAFRRIRTQKYGLTAWAGHTELLESEAAHGNGYTTGAVLSLGVEPFALFHSRESAQNLLARIPHPHWAKALQMHLLGYEQSEIARTLNCSTRTVYNWTEQAKRAVRQHLMETHTVSRDGRPLY